MSGWKEEVRERLQKIKETYDGFVKDAPLTARQKEKVREACIVDALQLLKEKDSAVPKPQI